MLVARGEKVFLKISFLFLEDGSEAFLLFLFEKNFSRFFSFRDGCHVHVSHVPFKLVG